MASVSLSAGTSKPLVEFLRIGRGQREVDIGFVSPGRAVPLRQIQWLRFDGRRIDHRLPDWSSVWQAAETTGSSVVRCVSDRIDLLSTTLEDWMLDD